MIWLLALLLILTVSLYLCAPFLSRRATVSETEEIAAYREELRALQTRIDAGEIDDASRAQKAVLQGRLLSAAKTDAPLIGRVSKLTPALLTLGLIGGTLGIYGAIGSPNFTPEKFQPPPPAAPEQPDFNAILPQIEARLADDPDDPRGWYLYGRTLMLVDRYEDGFAAYERSLELNDNAAVRREYEAAKLYAEQRQSGPSAEDIEAAQQLSPEQQQEMILGMVASLRAKLDDNPNDPQGWTRLLRARQVLGQTEEAKADMADLRSALPEQAEAIIAETGWE